jgi:hypothetical protein
MKLSTAIIISFTILATGCTIHQPKQAERVGPGTFYAKWQNEVMDACSDKAAEVVLKFTADKYKEGILLTEEQIVMIHGILVRKCSMNSGLVI